MVKLERPVMQGRAISVDMPVFANGDDALAFIGMADVGQDHAYLGEAGGDFIQMARQRALQRGLGDKRGAGVQQHWQMMLSGVLPEIVEAAVLRQESRVHGHQLDAFKL